MSALNQNDPDKFSWFYCARFISAWKMVTKPFYSFFVPAQMSLLTSLSVWDHSAMVWWPTLMSSSLPTICSQQVTIKPSVLPICATSYIYTGLTTSDKGCNSFFRIVGPCARGSRWYCNLEGHFCFFWIRAYVWIWWIEITSSKLPPFGPRSFKSEFQAWHVYRHLKVTEKSRFTVIIQNNDLLKKN